MASVPRTPEEIKLLIERRVNVNIKDTFYGQTPLSSAVKCGSVDIVALLLAKGVDGKDDASLAGLANKNLDRMKVVIASGGLKPDTLREAVTRRQ